jgi:spore germination protein GerM
MKKRPYILIWTAALLIIIIFMLPSCTRSVSLYFAHMEGEEFRLVPETREIDASGDIYMEAVRQLIEGPRDKKLYSTLPSDTTVNYIKVSEGLAVVDFGISIISSFQEIPHSSTTETLAIYSIVNTLTGFDEIDRVRITVEGMESGKVEGFYVEDFWGHIGIYEEFTRNEEIIKDE